MEDDNIQSAAHALAQARVNRIAIPRISETFGIEGLERAYAVATVNTQARVASGARVIGKKVGLTSRAVQQQLGVDQPDFGVLFDDMAYLNQDEVPYSRLIQPKAEAEVAFVIGRDLDSRLPSYGEFLASLAYALPAIEIVDSAIENWKLTLVDTVADNASCGVFVLGDQPITVGTLSLGEIGLQMDLNGHTASVGSGAACLGHPLRAAFWLARTMGQRGDGLRAGDVVLSGALGPMVAVQRGDAINTRIGSLGSVCCRMV